MFLNSSISDETKKYVGKTWEPFQKKEHMKLPGIVVLSQWKVYKPYSWLSPFKIVFDVKYVQNWFCYFAISSVLFPSKAFFFLPQ